MCSVQNNGKFNMLDAMKEKTGEVNGNLMTLQIIQI